MTKYSVCEDLGSTEGTEGKNRGELLRQLVGPYDLTAKMRILFVHECFGACAGPEANLLATATELKRRGHNVGILHGPGTGRAEEDWEGTFRARWFRSITIFPDTLAGSKRSLGGWSQKCRAA